MSKRVCVSGRPCVSGTTCASEMARVSEWPCVRETACVRSLCEREMTVGMRENAAASPCPSVMSRCVSVVTRRSACVKWRWGRRQKRDNGRAAAVAISSTVPGLHGSEREVRAVFGPCCARGRRVLACASATRSGNARGGCCRSCDGQKLGWIMDSERMGSPGGRVCETLRGLRRVFCSQSALRRLRTGRAHVLAWGTARSVRFALECAE